MMWERVERIKGQGAMKSEKGKERRFRQLEGWDQAGHQKQTENCDCHRESVKDFVW